MQLTCYMEKVVNELRYKKSLQYVTSNDLRYKKACKCNTPKNSDLRYMKDM